MTSSPALEQPAALSDVGPRARRKRTWPHILLPLAPLIIFYFVFLVYPIVVLGTTVLEDERPPGPAELCRLF